MKTAQVRLESNLDSFDDREAYGERFRKASDDEIHEWIKSKEPSIAIQAQWEEMNRTAVVMETPDGPVLHPEKLEAFLDRLKVSVPTGIPDWQRTGFLNVCQKDRRSRLSDWRIDHRFRTTDLSDRAIRHPNESRIKRRGDQVYYLFDNAEVRVPADLLQGMDRGISGISAVILDHGYYLFAYDGDGNCEQVVCIDRKMGQERWRKKTCGCYWGGIQGLIIGPGAGELITDDDEVFAYYLNSLGAYVHGFRASDGKTTFMFSTGF